MHILSQPCSKSKKIKLKFANASSNAIFSTAFAFEPNSVSRVLTPSLWAFLLYCLLNILLQVYLKENCIYNGSRICISATKYIHYLLWSVRAPAEKGNSFALKRNVFCTGCRCFHCLKYPIIIQLLCWNKHIYDH